MKTEITFVCDNCGKRLEDKDQSIGMIHLGVPMDWYALSSKDVAWALCSPECVAAFELPLSDRKVIESNDSLQPNG